MHVLTWACQVPAQCNSFFSLLILCLKIIFSFGFPTYLMKLLKMLGKTNMFLVTDKQTGADAKCVSEPSFFPLHMKSIKDFNNLVYSMYSH